MDQLPTHVATADENIDELRDRLFDGPDMRTAMPIEAMLGLLHQRSGDVAGYVDLWLALVKSVGGFVSLTISNEGDEELNIMRPCDAQLRHRNRWLHFLSEDLNADSERRDLLIHQFIAKGRYADNRPADPRETTRVVRDWLRWGGRLLVNPEGELQEGGGVPEALISGTPDEADACRRAGRAYFVARRRWRTDRQIKRFVRMLGQQTDNGWLVLESNQ